MKKLMLSMSLMAVASIGAVGKTAFATTSGKKGHPCSVLQGMSEEKAGQAAELILYYRMLKMASQQLPLILQAMQEQSTPTFKGPFAMVQKTIYTERNNQQLNFMKQDSDLLSKKIDPLVQKELKGIGLDSEVLELIDDKNPNCCQACLNSVVELYMRAREQGKDLGLLPISEEAQ